MPLIRQDDVIQSVADALQYISYYHSPDFIQAMAKAYEGEQSPAAKDAIKQILVNSRMCAEGHRPICQDTGIVTVFVRRTCATRGLFKRANTPKAIHALGVEGLSEYIKTIGLFNSKARNVIALCEQLLQQHGGKVPESREALEALPGVGRKTANVVLNTAFGQPTIAVDTHIFRVANRTGLAPGENVRAVEDHLVKVVPDEYKHDAHHWLILHGRYICIARKPKCPICPIRELCEYTDKTPSEELKPTEKAGPKIAKQIRALAKKRGRV